MSAETVPRPPLRLVEAGDRLVASGGQRAPEAIAWAKIAASVEHSLATLPLQPEDARLLRKVARAARRVAGLLPDGGS